MSVSVKFAATLGKEAGMKQMMVEAADVKTLLRTVQNAFRGNKEFLLQLKLCNLIVNNTNVNYLSGLKTELSDGDVVTFFPPLGGG